MPLFTRLGLPDDATFSFESNPDPKLFTEVKAKPEPKRPKPAPEKKSPVKSVQADVPAKPEVKES